MHTYHGTNQEGPHVAWMAAAHLVGGRPPPIPMRALEHTSLDTKKETCVGQTLVATAGPVRALVVALVLVTKLACVLLPATTRVLVRARGRSNLELVPCK